MYLCMNYAYIKSDQINWTNCKMPKLHAKKSYIMTSDKAYFEKFVVYYIVLQN